MFVQLEFSACYVALDPGRQEAEPVLVILLQRMTPPAAPPAATPTPLTHTDPSLTLPAPAAATVLQLGQGSQAAAGQQAAGAGAGSDQGPGAVGGGSGGAQPVSGSQLSSQLTFQLQLSHLALAHATAIITIMTLDGQVLYQNGRSVEYLGFMTGQAAAAGQSLHAPHHLLRRIFAADPLALDALMVATGQGQRPGPPQPSAALIDQEKGMDGMQRALNLLGRKTGGGQPSPQPG
ncbi:guanylate cyclase domain-containing protein [Haematococcus lacustris]|uniref:Guanylate cyclase domain-containing protein n=1 Tax=Haematococcus lacustris TaxID=44745 RepID=A0A699ZXV5_HAELA|nr:guanylate cyclase domain-containing protein [Haematococcus lacustris]